MARTEDLIRFGKSELERIQALLQDDLRSAGNDLCASALCTCQCLVKLTHYLIKYTVYLIERGSLHRAPSWPKMSFQLIAFTLLIA